MKTNTRDVVIGICLIAVSGVLLLTPLGLKIFVPFEGCEAFLHLYYYLIGYALLIGGIFFVLRGSNIIKYD